MPAVFHTFLLTLAVGAAYWWVTVPEFNMYSLQAIGLVILIYFLIKRSKKAALWHVLPTALSLETALATFAFLSLIGSTGNTSSILYPLIYVHLFLIVFSSEPLTSIIMTVELMLWHYALTPDISNSALVSLLTLPIILIFFLFAKRQHEELVRDRLIIRQEKRELELLEKEDDVVRGFVTKVSGKIGLLKELLSFPAQNAAVMQQHLTNVQLELEKLRTYLKTHWWGWQHDKSQE